MTRLLTVEEAAKALGLHPKTLRKRIALRQVEIVKPLGLDAIRIRESEVERIIAAGTTHAAPVWEQTRRRTWSR